MRNLLFIIGLLFVFSTISSAQGYYDKCYSGTAGLDFSGWFPSALTNSDMESLESAASMCSENGDLLFYSNGGNSPTNSSVFGAVWNANHQVMENGVLGDSSGCISSFDGAVAFPAIEQNSTLLSTSTYYLFTRDCVESSFSNPGYNSGLTYCVIDMDANNGLGKVVSKNNIAVSFDPGEWISTDQEPLSAILNGSDDGWLVFSYNLDSLYSIEVKNNVVSNMKYHVQGDSRIIFSPARDHVMVGDVLYDYNATNNELSFSDTLSGDNFAFSPNGKILYGLGGGSLKQYDLEATNIQDDKIEIGTGLISYQLFLAPDHRIYLYASGYDHTSGFIDCPNTLGLNCGLSMTFIYLGGKKTGDIFTSIPANFLYYDERGCVASQDSYEIETAPFKVYPNPSTGLVKISMNTLDEPQPFQIVSVDGKVVFKGIMNSLKEEINLRSVDAGLYFLEIRGQQKSFVLR